MEIGHNLFNLLPGKNFEEIFGEKDSALDRNPFQENGGPVNPNARPVGGR